MAYLIIAELCIKAVLSQESEEFYDVGVLDYTMSEGHTPSSEMNHVHRRHIH